MSSIDPLAALAVILALVLSVVLLAALERATRRAGLDARERQRTVLRSGVPLGGWLVLTGILAHGGFFSNLATLPPRPLVAALGGVAVLLVPTLTPSFRGVLAAMPVAWSILLQTFRIPVELGLWALHARGALPVQMTFQGRNFDILVGITAPLVALAVSRGRVPRGAQLAWHGASLALLTNIVVIAVTSMPGPLNAGWPGVTNRIVAEFPFVWLPTFLVPLALTGHVVALRQLGRSARARSQPDIRSHGPARGRGRGS